MPPAQLPILKSHEALAVNKKQAQENLAIAKSAETAATGATKTQLTTTSQPTTTAWKF